MKSIYFILLCLFIGYSFADCTPDPVCDPCDGVAAGASGSCSYTDCTNRLYTYPRIDRLPIPSPSPMPSNACNLNTNIRQLPFTANGTRYEALPANNVSFNYQECVEQTETNPSCPGSGGGGGGSGPACGPVSGGINGTCSPGTASGGSQAGGLLYWTCTLGGTTINCSGTACFIKGTQVLMADLTYKNIEDIEVGDKVIGSNQSVNTVLELKPSQHVGKKYSINGGPFFVTEGHPFMTTSGWRAFNPEMAKAINPSLNIEKLSEGDYLVMTNRFEKVERVEWIQTEEMVYNFELDGTKDYYADDFLVHNK